MDKIIDPNGVRYKEVPLNASDQELDSGEAGEPD